MLVTSDDGTGELFSPSLLPPSLLILSLSFTESIVLFGGVDRDNYYNDVWQYDPGNLQRLYAHACISCIRVCILCARMYVVRVSMSCPCASYICVCVGIVSYVLWTVRIVMHLSHTLTRCISAVNRWRRVHSGAQNAPPPRGDNLFLIFFSYSCSRSHTFSLSSTASHSAVLVSTSRLGASKIRTG